MRFTPNQRPWSVLVRVLRANLLRAVVLGYAAIQVVRVTDVQPPGGILENVGPEFALLISQPPRVRCTRELLSELDGSFGSRFAPRICATSCAVTR